MSKRRGDKASASKRKKIGTHYMTDTFPDRVLAGKSETVREVAEKLHKQPFFSEFAEFMRIHGALASALEDAEGKPIAQPVSDEPTRRAPVSDGKRITLPAMRDLTDEELDEVDESWLRIASEPWPFASPEVQRAFNPLCQQADVSIPMLPELAPGWVYAGNHPDDNAGADMHEQDKPNPMNPEAAKLLSTIGDVLYTKDREIERLQRLARTIQHELNSKVDYYEEVVSLRQANARMAATLDERDRYIDSLEVMNNKLNDRLTLVADQLRSVLKGIADAQE